MSSSKSEPIEEESRREHEKLQRETAKPPCLKWLRTGRCEFGANCRFSHSPAFFASQTATAQKYPSSLMPPPEGGYMLDEKDQVRWGEGEYKWDGVFQKSTVNFQFRAPSKK